MNAILSRTLLGERAPPKSAPGEHSAAPSEAIVVLDARVVCGTGGGPDKTILNQPRFLTAAGYRNLCAYMYPLGDPGFESLRQRTEAAEAPLLEFPDRGPWDWRVIGRMLEICRRERVAIWHGHDYKSNALGLLLRRFWPMRLVTTVHGWVKHTRRTPLYYRIDRFCLPRYERVICVSQDLHGGMSNPGVPAERCVLIENGIDLAEYARIAAGRKPGSHSAFRRSDWSLALSAGSPTRRGSTCSSAPSIGWRGRGWTWRC